MGKPDKFVLGQRVRDTVTGFEGIAIGRVVYINGCHQYLVKPKCVPKDDEPMKQPEGWYIDDQSLELVDEGILEPPHELNATYAQEVGHRSVGGPDAREGELPT